MESKHISRNVNVSIRKVRMILPAIKKLSPAEAVTKLEYMPHSSARYVRMAIVTAMSNASAALKLSPDMLEFRGLYADQGLVLKRHRAGSRGSPLPVVRRMSHISVILGEKKAVAPKAHSKAKVEKTSKTTEEAPKKSKVVRSKSKVSTKEA